MAAVAVGMDPISGGLFRQGAKSQVVTHTEYVGEIAGSTGFKVAAYALNPGQPGLFPWLSKIASRYEKFRFKNLEFLFQTEKSSATNGTVIFAVDYDASDDKPDSKTQLLQNEDKERAAPWQKFSLKCSRHNLTDTLARFVRPSAVPGGADIKTYDLGTLYVGTSGMADTSSVGELYVRYDVELMTPILEETGVAYNNRAYVLQTLNFQVQTSGVWSAFNGVNLIELKNPDVDAYSISPSGDITVPPGVYQISGWTNHTGSGTTTTVAFNDIFLNGVSIYDLSGSMQPPRQSSPGTSYINLPLNGIVTTKDGDVITIRSATTATGPVAGAYVEIVAL